MQSEEVFVRIEREALERYSTGNTPNQIQAILKGWFPRLREKARDIGDWGIGYEGLVFEAEQVLKDIQWALAAYKVSSDWPGSVSKAEKRLGVPATEAKKRLEFQEEHDRGILWIAPAIEKLNDPVLEWNWRDFSPVDKDSLDKALVEYLEKDWLQHNIIDWAAINALLFDEYRRTNEGIASGAAIEKINWAWYLADRDSRKIHWGALKVLLFRFAMRWAVPAIIILVLAGADYPRAAMVAGGFWAVYLFGRLISYPGRRHERKEAVRTVEKVTNSQFATITALQYAGHEVINPTRLKEWVIEAEAKGAVFRPVIHSLLDRAIQRDPAVLSVSV